MSPAHWCSSLSTPTMANRLLNERFSAVREVSTSDCVLGRCTPTQVSRLLDKHVCPGRHTPTASRAVHVFDRTQGFVSVWMTSFAEVEDDGVRTSTWMNSFRSP